LSSFPDQIAYCFRRWLTADDLIDKLDPSGVPFLALPTDAAELNRLHEETHDYVHTLPHDAWVIGEDGAGNYWFCVGPDIESPVMFFEHEWQQVEQQFDTLRAYYEHFRHIAIRHLPTDCS